MARAIALICLVALGLHAQVVVPYRGPAFRPSDPGGCTVTTNTLAVTLLTSFGNTSNASHYATAEFTPSAEGATLIAFWEGSPSATDAVTNTGTTQLTWWLAGGTNFNTLASPGSRLEAWVSQLSPGVTPFAMRVVKQNASGTGGNIHVYEVTGADTNLLWGTNAIVQTTMNGSNATANPYIIWAPSNNGLNAVLYAVGDDINSGADNAPDTGWTEGAESNYNTPANGMASAYRLTMASDYVRTTNTATARDWAAIAVEVRAGTNNCSGSPLSPPFNPASIAGLKLWLKADAVEGLVNGDPVITWVNSGNGYHATQATSTKRPTYTTSVLNGKPIVRFDGTDDELANTAFFDFGDTMTVFVVVAFDSGSGANQASIEVNNAAATNTRFQFMKETNSKWRIGNVLSDRVDGDLRNGVFTIHTGWCDDVTTFYHTNATLVSSAALATNNGESNSGYVVGHLIAQASFYLNGDIAEVLIYDTSLSTANREAVRDYLNSKYAIY